MVAQGCGVHRSSAAAFAALSFSRPMSLSLISLTAAIEATFVLAETTPWWLMAPQSSDLHWGLRQSECCSCSANHGISLFLPGLSAIGTSTNWHANVIHDHCWRHVSKCIKGSLRLSLPTAQRRSCNGKVAVLMTVM